jgi:putative transposase
VKHPNLVCPRRAAHVAIASGISRSRHHWAATNPQRTPTASTTADGHGICSVDDTVSLPRRVLPGDTYLITRRCYQRAFRLRPSETTNDAFLYCLAVAARKSGVVVHAVVVMSNHHHAVVTDVEGALPIFLRELHRMTAKTLNATQGQWENLWSAEPTNAVYLAEAEDVLRKIAYVVANPVDAGLVAQPEEWPGVLVWGQQRLLAKRPRDYFDPKGGSDGAVELVIAPPRAALELADWDRRLAEEIAALVAKAHVAVRALGWRFLGRAAVLAASFVARAKSYETKRGVVPKVAAIHRETRRAVLREYAQFYAAYDDALVAWRAGDRRAVFPSGTWWMRVHHAALVKAIADAA